MNNIYISFVQKERDTHELLQANSSQVVQDRDLQELLHRLSNTNDIDVLVKIFSTLNNHLLTKNIAYNQAIKCDTMYRKLNLVLKSNLQTKTIVGLKFISATLNVVNENGSMSNTLHTYVKNMIRTSGCLTTMSEIFTSFMMQQDLWKALCRSISEACYSYVPNQSHCSHLVSLCIHRCQRGNFDPIQILISLLTNHPGNVQLFHESNGMTIFNRGSLHNPACLQLLNLVVENTMPEYHSEILKATDLFHELRLNLRKYEPNSSMGKWISSILFTHRKGQEINIEAKDKRMLTHQNTKTAPSSMNDTNNSMNETNELLAKILKEIGWQNQFGNNNFTNILHDNNKINNIEELPSFKEIYKPKINEQSVHNLGRQRNKSDSAFLMKEPRFGKTKYSFKLDQLPAEEILASEYETIFHLSKSDSNSKISKSDEYFKPPFASTPKSNKHAYVKPISRISRKTNSMCSVSRYRSVCNNIINRKTINRNASKSHDKSMTAKFMDIVNESCSTFIKGFKHMFAAKDLLNSINKSKEFSMEVVENHVYNHGFKNYLRQRNASDCAERQDQNGTNFTTQFSMDISDLHTCYTCNDSFVLKYKFHNDAFLQETVKKLKRAINIYGCDFKKISRTLWPREAYMTPSVLYNLYKNLIIKH